MSMVHSPKFIFNEKTMAHEMHGPSLDRVKQDLIMSFHRDVEGKIKQALIELGWTPPTDET